MSLRGQSGRPAELSSFHHLKVAGLSLTYPRPVPQFSPILIFFLNSIREIFHNLVLVVGYHTGDTSWYSVVVITQSDYKNLHLMWCISITSKCSNSAKERWITRRFPKLVRLSSKWQEAFRDSLTFLMIGRMNCCHVVAANTSAGWYLKMVMELTERL